MTSQNWKLFSNDENEKVLFSPYEITNVNIPNQHESTGKMGKDKVYELSFMIML